MPKTTFPSADRAFSGFYAARIEIPRARYFEIKAFLTQRRVLKGRLVYPLPPRGLEERLPPSGNRGLVGRCGGFPMTLEAKAPHEASRKAENILTGHKGLCLLLIRIHPDVPLSPEFAGFDHCHAFPGLGLPPFAGCLVSFERFAPCFQIL